MDIDYAAGIVPAPRQLAWQRQEFYGFIHFGMNTFTDQEWGTGQESPALFNPTHLDPHQWADTARRAGMTGLILTCKHHDGFCLWPSRYTDHTVAQSTWRDGQGDVVAETAQACREFGLKFGIYLSPWDRAEPTYGTGTPYNDFYINQLIELLTQYGPIFEVWLDGANGEGPNGKKQHYDWTRIYETVRRYQPEAVIAVSGPDVRWVGNEAGHTRTDEWSVVPAGLRDTEKTADRSQKADDAAFAQTYTSADDDLGSRQALADYTGPLVWYPAEVNTSIRPGWFYHADQDTAVKSADALFTLYQQAVGGNATLLLNLPPMPSGQLAEPDVAVLAALGHKINAFQQENLLAGGQVTFSSVQQEILTGSLITRGTQSGYWQPAADDSAPTVTVVLPHPVTLNALVLQEEISRGQHIEAVQAAVQRPGTTAWEPVATIGTVGYQRITRMPEMTVQAVRLVFTQYRQFLTLRYLGGNLLT